MSRCIAGAVAPQRGRLLVLAAALLCATGAAADRPELERIQVGKDGHGFVLERSGRPFHPWGVNYGHRGRLLEDFLPLTRDDLAPRADQTLSALLEDLHTRGLLDETLVIWMGEFGRAPIISDFASREHWPYANSILLAGGGMPGGTVFGATDPTGAEVTEHPVSPADVTATLLSTLGVHPATEMRDPGGRPYPLSEGRPVRF